MSLPIRPVQLAQHSVLVATALLLTGSDSPAQTLAETLEVFASDAAFDDAFGASVAISGTTAIVGAWRNGDNGSLSGSAYLFDTTTGMQLAKLLPSDGAASDRFGLSVAISGTTAIVGADLDDDNGSSSGSAYLFDTTTGMQLAKLLPSDGASDDRFGYSVAISGTTAIVGAWRDDDSGPESGSAYLFDTTTGMQLAKLLPSDGAVTDAFGVSVAISGTTAIVGASNGDDNGSNSGSAYLFDTTTGVQLAKLLPSDGAVEDFFGFSVAISGATAIVGVIGDDDNGSNSGSAYLFDTTTGMQLAKLLPSDGAVDDSFGWSVAISGTTAIVGAWGDDNNGSQSGSAYLFDTTGTQLARLLPSDGAPNDNFGVSVAISGTTSIVGASGNDHNGVSSGSAYFFSVPLPSDDFPVFCIGDGGDSMGCTDCPCNNNAPAGRVGGCLNSVGSSATLEASGTASLLNDTLRLEVLGAKPNTFGLLVSADSQLPDMGPCPPGSGIVSPELDGLRCIGGNLIRHGTRSTDATGDIGVTTPGWGPPNGSAGGLLAQAMVVAGQTRNLQCFYREDAAFGCQRGQSTTNAVAVTARP